MEFTHDVNERVQIGLAVGWGAVAVGLAGLILHLESQFFQVSTLQRLVYSAPFIAPLAFFRPIDRDFVRWALVVLALQAVTGLLGFYFHLRTGLLGSSPDLAENIIDVFRPADVLSPLVILSLGWMAPALGQPSDRLAPVLDGLGDHHHAITTDVAEAQQFVDQGLVLAFAFNHAEAARCLL